MEQKKALYEAIFIVNNTIGEEAIKETVEKFVGIVSANSELETVNEWGTRRLAYPINDMLEGYYVLVRFKSEPDFPAEFERLLNISDHIIRSLIIRVEE